MSDPFVGEIRIVGFNFAPKGWALCNGQLMPLSQNTALFSLLGTTYGGDGKATFALPNLQGRTPVAVGYSAEQGEIPLGDTGGSASVTLDATGIPLHSHGFQVLDTLGTVVQPAGAALASPRYGRARENTYAPASSVPQPNAMMLATAGSSQPHNNMPPYLVLSYVIALQGDFPPRP